MTTADHAAQRERAATLLQLRRPAEARPILEMLIASDASDAASMVLLGQCCAQLDDSAGAIEWSRRAGAAAPDQLSIVLDCASVARAAGNPSDAYAWATRALSMAPTNVRALNIASLAEIDLTMSGPAVTHAKAALAQVPDDPDLRVAYAMALTASGSTVAATAEYVQILEQVPTHVFALNNLAALRLQVGDLHRSVRLLARALAIDPRLSIAARNVGIVAGSFRRILLSRLALALAAIAIGRQEDAAVAYAVGGLLLGWFAWSTVRIPRVIRRRLADRLTLSDWVDVGLFVVGTAVAFLPDPHDPELAGSFWLLLVYGLGLTAVLAVRRVVVAIGLRRHGVRLP
jgi:tetratricopeptide (TPR) repeat protein